MTRAVLSLSQGLEKAGDETSDTTQCSSNAFMGLTVQWGQGDRHPCGQSGGKFLGGGSSNLQRIRKCWPDRDSEKGIPGRGHGVRKTGRRRTA